MAWALRDRPHIPIVTALACHQIAAATIDWVMWVWLADQGIFATSLARAGVVASIVLHYALGVLLFVAIRRHRRQ